MKRENTLKSLLQNLNKENVSLRVNVATLNVVPLTRRKAAFLQETLKAALLPVAALLLSAACKTTEMEIRPVSWQRQSAYLAKVRDPRIYGLSIYQTPGGIEYRGGGRLHPNQVEARPMGIKEPLRPVVMLTGNFGIEWPVLLDFTASKSWFEFSTAQKLGAKPVGERKAKMARLPGEEIAGCLSIIPSLRLGQLHISSPLIYVRLADGQLGTLARGIEKPGPKGVVGWDLLKKFEQIQFDYSGAKVLLATDAAYTPNPGQLITAVPLVKHAGACAVRGSIDGKETLILIDPAGDFEVATDGATPVSTIGLGEQLAIAGVAVSESPGGVRIGARLLQDYKLTVCPREGIIYFERPLREEEE